MPQTKEATMRLIVVNEHRDTADMRYACSKVKLYPTAVRPTFPIMDEIEEMLDRESHAIFDHVVVDCADVAIGTIIANKIAMYFPGQSVILVAKGVEDRNCSNMSIVPSIEKAAEFIKETL